MSSLASRVRPARLPRLVIALLATFPLLAGAARASQVTINLNGKVSVLSHDIANPNADLLLVAKGVTVGTGVTMKLVLESATPGVLVNSPYDHQHYAMAIVDVVLTAGTWEAHFAPPAGLEATNFVDVTDNGDYAGFKFDSWDGTALGVDTDNILSEGSSPTPYGAFQLHFVNSPPSPFTGSDLVEDLKKYKDATDTFGKFIGAHASMTVDFSTAPAGDEASLARQGQLKAAAKLGSFLLKGLGKLAAAGPDADPQDVTKNLLLQTSSDNFGLQFSKAIDKAAKKGGTAPLGESGKQDATDFLMAGLQQQSDAIINGVDNDNAVDRVLRGKLLKALAAECRADFVSHSKDVRVPNLSKLTAALDKSLSKLVKTVGAAIDKAGKQGLIYSGPNAVAINAALKPFVNSFVDLTGTGVQ